MSQLNSDYLLIALVLTVIILTALVIGLCLSLNQHRSNSIARKKANTTKGSLEDGIVVDMTEDGNKTGIIGG